MAHRVARQLKGRAPDVPPALSPELFDLLCEMRRVAAESRKVVDESWSQLRRLPEAAVEGDAEAMRVLREEVTPAC